MSAILQIAAATLRRSVRDRSFLALGIVAPFLIMAALSATIGPALAGEYQPSLVVADPTGSLDQGAIAALQASGFGDLTSVATESQARELIDDGDADAAIILPTAQPDGNGEQSAVRVLADADNQVAAEIAASIAPTFSNTASTNQILAQLGAPADDLSAPIALVAAEDVGSSVLTDSTYFAVGMSSFFTFFAASGFLVSYHQERRQSTLARMLVAPIGRYAPVVGRGIGVAMLASVSYTTLVVVSTLLLDAGWGPLIGVVATGLALVFTAVAVSTAVVALTKNEEAATQIAMVLATGWAIFGGVFVEIPRSGPIAAGAKLSPFTWALDAIGSNAGTGTLAQVLARAGTIALFGVGAIVIVWFRRRELVRP